MFKKIAQNIAKCASDVIGYGVLVTDENGIIIGCNDENRVGNFHEPSIKVMKLNIPITTTAEDALAIGNIHPGYTLPIQIFDNVIGSVSISGFPEDVARYGLLVQKQAEIMLREQAFLESSMLRERSLRDLIENIASFDERTQSDELITLQARELGFNLSRVSCVILIEMTKWQFESAEFAFRRLAVETKDYFSNPHNVICPNENYVVTALISRSEANFPCCDPEELDRNAKEFIKSMAEKGIEIDVSVGLPCSDIAGLARSLRSARNVLSLGKGLGAKGVIAARAFTAETLIDSLPKSKKEEYVTSTLKGLDVRNDFGEMRETFLAWCESPFACAEVAEKLAMHRNSLQYRLKKIRTITGKDPWNFKDAFELWAAFTMTKMK